MKTGEPLAVGHLLDSRYRIHKLLGVGGMGRVYLANDTRLANRPVAIKEMLIGDGAQERKAVEDFHREASVLARLSHPSIPQIIDYFDEHGRHYLVMEYVAGGDLQHRLDEMGAGARMPEPTVLEMARQLLEVLQFLHSQKPPIIYRDLKPGNIMIDHHGRAMLVDFGIARFLPPGGRGTQIGSVGYAPPEQYLGKMEPRSDLYALAATMHHLLTGRDPQLEAPFSFPAVNELAPEVSAQTAQIVMAALDKDIAHRPSSALAMKDLLPKPPLQKREIVVGGASSTATQQRSGIQTNATVVLDRPVTPARSPTPRSIRQIRIAPTPALSPPPVSAPRVDKAKHAAQAAPSQPAARIATGPSRLRPSAAADSARLSPNSRTADLGLRKGQNLPAEAPRASLIEPGKMLSRVAAVLASMRAMSAASGGSTRRVTPTPTTDQTLLSRQPAAIVPQSASAQIPTPPPLNGTSPHAFSSMQTANARLVSSADGTQFGLFENRVVLGRATSHGDGVDIDLSNLRRGVERISRRHAEIIKQGNDYFVRDLGSVNGTYISGRGRLGRDQLYKLKDRDELVLGGAKLEFRRG